MGKTNELNFTKRAIENLPVPAQGRGRFIDSATRGLGVAVMPSGEKTFYWYRKVNGYPQRETLGRHPDLTIEQARAAAEERNNRLAQWRAARFEGENPFASRRQELTLDAALEEYITRHIQQHSKRPESAAKELRSLVRRYMPAWRARPLGAIKREDVGELHRRVGVKYRRTANTILEMISAVFNFVEREQLYSGVNPVRGIQPYREPSRTRFLQPDEFAKLGEAVNKSANPDLRDAVSLALLTGARKGNLLSMRWSDVDLAQASWKIIDSKNSLPYEVPLTAEAVAILENRLRNRVDGNPWVFPAYRKTASGHLGDLKKRWVEALKVAGLDKADLRWHDLRRTMGSYLAAQGTSLLIIGRSLGHQSVSATQVYSRVNLDAVRQSMATANAAMVRLLTPKPLLEEAPKQKRSRRA